MKQTQTSLLKTVLYALGILAGMAFLITKNPAALAWVTAGDYRYGDLYRFSQIKRFKPAQALPTGVGSYRDSIDQGRTLPGADNWILVGDSFGFCDWGESPFHTQLGLKLGVPMFSIYDNHHPEFWRNPYLLLESRTNQTASPRILVYEIVERLIQTQFSAPIPFPAAGEPNVPAISRFQSFKRIKDDVLQNTETRHEMLLKHSFITSPLVSCWKTIAFERFHQLPDETPWYSLKPPFLFFRDEVTCFQAKHGDPLVTKLADNIALLHQNLRTRYNCILVFIPIPNKITVYSRLATDQSYDEFMPRLCAALKSRGVCTVELLGRFKQEKDFLYWPTDTHWNNLGIQIAIQETLKQLSQSGIVVGQSAANELLSR